MVEIDRINELAKEKGIKLSFICSSINKNEAYFRQIKAGRSNIPEKTLVQIADVLGTTVDYLHGKTDKKEKPGIVAELSERDIRILNIIRKLPDDVLDALELDLYRKGLL
jgi:transcriptional regulator with XRE-family HTH domain